MSADEIIKLLGLVPLPEEGGFYRETYRDPGVIPASSFSDRSGSRSYSTCIYYLITPQDFSGLHAVKSTEIFHFYAGSAVEMVQIDAEGVLSKIIIGNNLAQGECPQVIVPPGIWQGTKLVGSGEWALLGCTVAPGFAFDDFTGGTAEQLIAKFPQHAQIIREYTHS